MEISGRDTLSSTLRQSIDEEVERRLHNLQNTANTDEEFKCVPSKALDYLLHTSTTHLAMYGDALMKWRLTAGMKSPYDE